MKKKTQRTVGWIAFYLFVIIFVVLLLLPFIWQFLTSVKPLNEIAEMPAPEYNIRTTPKLLIITEILRVSSPLIV